MLDKKTFKPFFSIVIPTLNEADYIAHLLSDLEKQTIKNFEVIIVDGKSEDTTIREVKKYKHSIPLCILTTDKKNVSYQRNLGAGHAKGNFLIFIDADCRIHTTFLKELERAIEKYKHLIYMTAMLPEEKRYMHETYTTLSNFTTEISHIIGKPFVTSSTLVIERNCFNFIGKYDDKMTIYEDQEIVQRAFRSGISAKLLKNIGVIFCFRRFEKEGVLEIYKKYLIATAYILMKGKIYEHIVDYKMEGGAYHKISPMDKKKKQDTLKKAIITVKRMVKTINAELKKL